MKQTAYLINTSRGELVDEDALYNALESGTIAGAAQDVFSQEPPSKDNKLLSLDNFILTPHIGAYTRESTERMVVTSVKNLMEMLF
jgi:D-3-phosphoglycerate dehydrogenase